MKKKQKIKTVDGKEVLGFQFIPEENVYIGLIKGEKSEAHPKCGVLTEYILQDQIQN